MFKGFTPELKNKIEKFNQNSKSFIFCLSDLQESSDRGRDQYGEVEKKFDILSPELQQKLENEVGVSNPKAIKFVDAFGRTSEDIFSAPSDRNLFISNRKRINKHKIWIMFRKKGQKKSLADLNQKNHTKTIYIPVGSYKWRTEVNMLDFSLKKVLKVGEDEGKRILRAENKAIEEHAENISKVRGQTFQEINQTISECSIDIEKAEIDWLAILPTWCHCEVSGNISQNAKLWEHHINNCLWREESEIIDFKNIIVAAVISAFEKDKGKFDNYKNKVIQEIIKIAQERGFSESQLETKYPNWKTPLLAYQRKNEVDDYRKKAEEDIKKLTAVKNDNQTNSNIPPPTNTEQTGSDEPENPGIKNNNEGRESSKKPNNTPPNNKPNIQTLREKVISIIKVALSQEPKLANSDLDFKYQNWETELSGLLEESQINSLKDKVLAHISSQRKAQQTSKKVDDDLKKAQAPNATIQEKKEALDNLDKNEGERAYEAKKEQIKEAKKEVARNNPNEYKNKVISNLEKKLAENELNESDLDDETQQEIKRFKNSADLEPENLVETEIKLTKKIGEAGAKKKMDNLAIEVEKVLKKKDKTQIEKLKNELLQIINSHSVYYSTHKSQAEKLLKQLENISVFNQPQSPSSNSQLLSVKIGIGVVIILVFGFFIFLIWKKKRIRGCYSRKKQR